MSIGGPTVLAVRDIGFRGFSIETAEPVPPHMYAQFEFSAAAASFFLVADAVAVHCHSGPGPGRWTSGWEFPEQPGLDEVLDRVIDSAFQDGN